MNSPLTASGSTPKMVVVFPPDRSGIGALAVPPPYPVGYKLQPDGSLGVNINMVHGDLDGLLVYILAYLNMQVGDFIRVFIETKSTPVAEFPITDAHFDSNGLAKNIPFHISSDTMHDKFAPLLSETKDIWVEVRRISDNSTEDSPHAPLFYKHPAPGEPDTDGGKPFNQGLKLPVATETDLDQNVIDNGMFVTVLSYFNQQIGDTVVLAFGPLRLEIKVTVLGDILFELTPAILATLKPASELVVRYLIYDVVENTSGWSESLLLKFNPGVVLLPAPIFEQADPNDEIDHDDLAGSPVKLLLTGTFAKDDLINVFLEGLTKGGDPASHVDTQTLTTSSRTLNIQIANEWARNLIGGSLHTYFELTRAGKTQNSKSAKAVFSGTSQPLGPPTVSPLETGDTIPVDSPSAMVKFAEYWPLKTGATAELRWQTVDEGGVPVLFIFQQLIADPAQAIIFTIPAKYIAPYADSSLTLQCAITNPGRMQVVSDLLQLKISAKTTIVLDPPYRVPKTDVSPIDPLGPDQTIRVEYPAAIARDQARLIELNAPTGSAPFALTPLNANQRANWLLDTKWLVAHHGMSVGMRWNLRRNDKKVASSPSTPLVILPIAAGDKRLPTPRISGVDTETVDVTKLTAANRLVADPWPGQRPGQPRYLTLVGTNNSIQQVQFEMLKGEPTDDEPGLSAELPLAWLQTLKNNSPLLLKLSVNLHGISDKPSAVPFPEKTYLIQSQVEKRPQITYVIDSKGVDIPDNGETTATSATAKGVANELRQVEILVDGQLRATVATTANGDFSVGLSGFRANAVTTLQVRAKYGDNLLSPQRTIRNYVPTLSDLTLFNNGMNGWIRGAGAPDPRDIILGTYYGRSAAQNASYTNATGVMLYKTYTNLEVGRRYSFLLYAANGNWAVLSVTTSQGESTGAFTPRTQVWEAYSLSFVPRTKTVTVNINTHVPSHVGNDSFVTNLQLG